MNLKALNKVELDQRLKSLAQKERDLLHEILLTIKEIDCRRTYLELGFGSLFDYMVQGIGYSEGSAQRRIDAARLLREIPEIASKIQSGEIKLNQISLVQKASREIFKSQSKKVTPAEKFQILESICDKNHAQSQQQVAEFFDLPVLQNSQVRTQADESVRIELTLSKEAHARIRKAQELLSHAIPNHELSSFLEYLADKVIKQKTSKKIGTTATVAVADENKNCCEYVDPSTGRRCRSTWKLEIDHKQSRWAGGNDDSENLQFLCSGHNKMKYRLEAGLRYLS
ncbi:HNH endonuclease [Bdellovibrio sp. HCB209]|uniref:HNH endonuclease n=1 Tax=Bdellovibrio sp. HCB209 TaxID=3394354 RepID=UPI0039B64BC6